MIIVEGKHAVAGLQKLRRPIIQGKLLRQINYLMLQMQPLRDFACYAQIMSFLYRMSGKRNVPLLGLYDAGDCPAIEPARKCADHIPLRFPVQLAYCCAKRLDDVVVYSPILRWFYIRRKIFFL